jgi:hypothetical protein
MNKVPQPADIADRWADNTASRALQRASAGLLVEGPPFTLWVFDYDLRKVSRRGGKTATISLGRPHLRHLGLEMGDLVRLIPRKDGTITIKKASAKDLRQANPYTKLVGIPGKKGKRATSGG